MPMNHTKSFTYVPLRSELSEGNPTRRKMQIVEPSLAVCSETKIDIFVETEDTDIAQAGLNLDTRCDGNVNIEAIYADDAILSAFSKAAFDTSFHRYHQINTKMKQANLPTMVIDLPDHFNP